MSIVSTKCKVHGKLHVKWGKMTWSIPLIYREGGNLG